ncbi:protein S100-A7-like [Eudromia elegans]
MERDGWSLRRRRRSARAGLAVGAEPGQAEWVPMRLPAATVPGSVPACPAMSVAAAARVAQPRQLPGNCSMETALKSIVDVYHRYSARQSALDLLSFQDFQQLLTEQAPSFLAVCGRSRPGYLEKLFKETDISRDRELSFEEFCIVLAKLADDAHRISHGSERCGREAE